jgi:uncharacterized protein YcbX
MRVEEIWRYPVKSLGGERLDIAVLGERGIPGDRAWGILDLETGLVLTARREPTLLFLGATHRDGDRPTITGDDGSDLSDDDALSRRIGRPVRLVSADDGPATFENPMNIDEETDWFQWESAGLTFHDGRSTVSLVSTATLGEWDRRRFRINLIVDGPADGLVDSTTEDELEGEIAIGGATIRIRRPIERCVMVTRAQPGIERDLSVLKTIIAERDNKLGIGGVVTTPGPIAVGDEVRNR